MRDVDEIYVLRIYHSLSNIHNVNFDKTRESERERKREYHRVTGTYLTITLLF